SAMVLEGRKEEARRILDSIKQKIPPLTSQGLLEGEPRSTSDLKDALYTRKRLNALHFQLALTEARWAAADHQYIEAEKFLMRAIGFSPTNWRGYQALMDLKRLQNKPEERLHWADEALKKLSGHPLLSLDKAEALLALGRPAEAAQLADPAASLYP